MTKFYIAGRYTRREELKGYAEDLEDLGYHTTSRWLLGPTDDRADDVAADQDIADLIEADVVLHFTEKPDIGYNSGGRHVEYGVVIGLNCMTEAMFGKHIHNVVIGPRENIFHSLECIHFDNWEDFKGKLVDAIALAKGDAFKDIIQ